MFFCGKGKKENLKSQGVWGKMEYGGQQEKEEILRIDRA